VSGTVVPVPAFAPRIDRRTAEQRLAPAPPWRWLAPRPERAHLELVHLPYRLGTATVRYREGREPCEREIACLVCANTGAAFRIESARVALAPAPVDALPAILDSAELDRRALDYLRRWTSAPRRPPGSRLHGEPRYENRGYPIWMAIHERRAGRLDISGVDAVTGARIGSATRQALLLALGRSAPAAGRASRSLELGGGR
jgi:hypothetical protein